MGALLSSGKPPPDSFLAPLTSVFKALLISSVLPLSAKLSAWSAFLGLTNSNFSNKLSSKALRSKGLGFLSFRSSIFVAWASRICWSGSTAAVWASSAAALGDWWLACWSACCLDCLITAWKAGSASGVAGAWSPLTSGTAIGEVSAVFASPSGMGGTASGWSVCSGWEFSPAPGLSWSGSVTVSLEGLWPLASCLPFSSALSLTFASASWLSCLAWDSIFSPLSFSNFPKLSPVSPDLTLFLTVSVSSLTLAVWVSTFFKDSAAKYFFISAPLSSLSFPSSANSLLASSFSFSTFFFRSSALVSAVSLVSPLVTDASSVLVSVVASALVSVVVAFLSSVFEVAGSDLFLSSFCRDCSGKVFKPERFNGGFFLTPFLTGEGWIWRWIWDFFWIFRLRDLRLALGPVCWIVWVSSWARSFFPSSVWGEYFPELK